MAVCISGQNWCQQHQEGRTRSHALCCRGLGSRQPRMQNTVPALCIALARHRNAVTSACLASLEYLPCPSAQVCVQGFAWTLCDGFASAYACMHEHACMAGPQLIAGGLL